MIPSPCNNVCRIDPASGYCLGCARTLEEIGDWTTMSDDKKLGLLERLRERQPAPAKPASRTRDAA